MKLLKILGVTVLTSSLLVACSSEEEVKEEPKKQEEKKTEETKKPAVKSMDLKAEGNSVTVSFEVENFVVNPEHYGGEHVDGEGHPHLFLDGEKVTMLKSLDSYVIENVPAGEHKVKITLQKNDHEDYGAELEKTVNVE